MNVRRTPEDICEETINRISSYLFTHDISDYQFSRELGLHKQTYGRMARFERKLSIEIITRAGYRYGFKMIGDEWNPYPGVIDYLDITPEQIYQRVRDNLSEFKKFCKENGLSFYRFAQSSPDITRDGVYQLLRSRGGENRTIQLNSIIALAEMLHLPNVGAMYASRPAFMKHIRGGNYNVYKKSA